MVSRNSALTGYVRITAHDKIIFMTERYFLCKNATGNSMHTK